jgi:hypothetical protein
MKKIRLILIAVVGIVAIFSCNRENDPIDENATTRGSNANDSTEKGGITLNTEWGPDSTVNF